MSHQMMVALGVELLLVTATSMLLVQPSFLFPPQSRRARLTASWSGFFLLALTFCWSVVTGCVIYLNRLVIQL